MDIQPEVLGPIAAAVATAISAAGVAMWRQITRRIDDLRADLVRAQGELLECAEARGRAEAKIEMLDERLARIENGRERPSERAGGG